MTQSMQFISRARNHRLREYPLAARAHVPLAIIDDVGVKPLQLQICVHKSTDAFPPRPLAP